MSSYIYFKIDPERSSKFLNSRDNEEIPRYYTIPLKDIYAEPKTIIVRVGPSASEKYLKYLIHHQRYIKQNAKPSKRPTDRVSIHEVRIYRPIDDNYIIFEGDRDIITEVIEIMTDSKYLKLDYYTINILKYKMDNEIQYIKASMYDTLDTYTHYRKPKSENDIFVGVDEKNKASSHIVHLFSYANIDSTVVINERGNIFFYRKFDESYEPDLVYTLIKKLINFMRPSDTLVKHR